MWSSRSFPSLQENTRPWSARFRSTAYVAPGRRLVTTAIRDSKDPEGLALSFRLDEWAAFALKVKAGVYDLQAH
ncbi:MULTISPECIES: DUF397 domain-containing protein [unclassified Spirillospora]|uniref:DUF397 domain-containing protein n=1 Tax=unclassified Spirillospora TaxID=2642701 RepID=UPI00371F9C9E